MVFYLLLAWGAVAAMLYFAARSTLALGRNYRQLSEQGISGFLVAGVMVSAWFYLVPPVLVVFSFYWPGVINLVSWYVPAPWVLLFYIPGLVMGRQLAQLLADMPGDRIGDSESATVDINGLCYLGLLYIAVLVVLILSGMKS